MEILKKILAAVIFMFIWEITAYKQHYESSIIRKGVLIQKM